MQVLVVDVSEGKKKAGKWAKKRGFTFPVLDDADGKVAEAWAPEGVLPDIPRNEIAIASNVIVGRDGKIAFFSLLDSQRFDAKLVALEAKLVSMLAEEKK